MAFNWKKFFYIDKSSLLFIGCMLVFSAIGFLYIDITRPRVNDKTYLIFLKGELESHNFFKNIWGDGDYTISLKGYKHRFQIIAEFIPLFKRNNFENSAYQNDVIIAVPKRAEEGRGKYYIFSIVSNNETYLNYEETIKKYNNNFIKFTIVLFSILGVISIFFGYRFRMRAKQKN